MILDTIVNINVAYTTWLGNRFEDAAEFLDKTSETLRWLAALTRVTP